MSGALSGLRIGLIERRHPAGHRGSLVERLVPLLRQQGAAIAIVHAEEGWHRLDTTPAWDVAVLKSGSAAALHLAAAAEAWGIVSLNGSDATRLTQDKLASAAILQRAGLPIAPARLVWLGPDFLASPACENHLELQVDRRLMLKAARGSRGVGLWTAEPRELTALAGTLPAGPYLIMDWIPHESDDLKVFVAGDWMTAIERSFPATTPVAKQGRPVIVPPLAAEVCWEVGKWLGLTCFGCDFVDGPNGWTLVDVNAFPGYKGAPGAADAIAREIARVAAEGLTG